MILDSTFREYPSLEFIITLMENSNEFVIRLPKTVFKRKQEGMKTNYEYVDVEIAEHRIHAYKDTELEAKMLKYKKLNLRFTRIQLDESAYYEKTFKVKGIPPILCKL